MHNTVTKEQIIAEIQILKDYTDGSLNYWIENKAQRKPVEQKIINGRSTNFYPLDTIDRLREELKKANRL